MDIVLIDTNNFTFLINLVVVMIVGSFGGSVRGLFNNTGRPFYHYVVAGIFGAIAVFMGLEIILGDKFNLQPRAIGFFMLTGAFLGLDIVESLQKAGRSIADAVISRWGKKDGAG